MDTNVKNIEIIVGETEEDMVYHKGQKINYINILNTPKASSNSIPPSEHDYSINNMDFSALLNYYAFDVANTMINNYQGLMLVTKSAYQTVDLFKQEVLVKNGSIKKYIKVDDEQRSQISQNNSETISEILGVDANRVYYISPSTNEYKPILQYNPDENIRAGGDGTFTKYYPILYIQEIEENQPIVSKVLTPLKLVKDNISDFSFRDFNVSNDRQYRYVFYPLSDGDRLIREDAIIKTKWDSWSITELHPLDSSRKKYYVSNDDIWIFNLNVETGEQIQNISKSENINLGTYPRYSQGRQNRISGSVSCLMGSDVIPLSYLEYGKGISFTPYKRDGYNEIRYFNAHPTSNEKVDMIKKWRSLVFSKNPKLLKDRKGQSFLVTLTNSANKPYDNIKNQPDVISFNWSEIQSLDDVIITDIKDE